jgi:large subunit ribosomal protein L31
MKKKGHPNYKVLKLNIGGDSFSTFSTYHGSEYFMDVDYRKHPAWTRSSSTELSKTNQNVNSFNKRFSGLSFGLSNKS